MEDRKVIMGWRELSPAIWQRFRSLTKVWISQSSSVVFHLSSSLWQNITMPKHKQRERWERERERGPATRAHICSWCWGQALQLTLPTSASVQPEIAHKPRLFSAAGLWIVGEASGSKTGRYVRQMALLQFSWNRSRRAKQVKAQSRKAKATIQKHS